MNVLAFTQQGGCVSLQKNHSLSHLTRSDHSNRPAIVSRRPQRHLLSTSHPTCTANISNNDNPDIIIIGSGLGGLSAAALLSSAYSKNVLVLESHTIPGGAAHAFKRTTSAGTFTFDSGPHLFSGLSNHDAGVTRSANPMQHVLRAVNAELDVVPYDTWGCLFPEGYFATKVSTSEPLFGQLIEEVSGAEAAGQVASLLTAMRPLCRAATAVPAAAFRAGDGWGSMRVAGRFVLRGDLIGCVPHVGRLSEPFSGVLNEHVRDGFARRFIELLCFLLAGVGAEKMPTAEMAFMFSEWMGVTGGCEGSDCVLEHPVGGGSGIVEALVGAVESGEGSRVRTGAHVERVLFEGPEGGRRAVGVELKSGECLYAKEGVITNVSAGNLPGLLGGGDDDDDAEGVGVPKSECDSFVHLHVGIELTEEVKESLPYELEANYVSVEDWSRGIEAEQNVVLMSIPSVLDSSLAPENHIVLHAYTPATEGYEMWEGLERGSREYEEMKEKRSEVLWRAVEKIIPNARKYAKVEMIGSPLTHERFLRRMRGSYGPAVDASDGVLTLPLGDMEGFADGLFAVGDGVFPGVGVPAVAASAWMAANAFVSVGEHEEVLKEIGL